MQKLHLAPNNEADVGPEDQEVSHQKSGKLMTADSGENSTISDQALEYARHGWSIFPVAGVTDDGVCSCSRGPACERTGKHPFTTHGFHDASQDEDAIRKWWEKWPLANVAIRTGRESKLLVLDVDPRNGGNESLIKLQAQNEALPPTPRCLTGGGGWHYYFQHPGIGGLRGKIPGFPGLDVKGDGGYVVAPPSMHASGNTYRWERDWYTTALAPVPDWLLRLIQEEKPFSSPAGQGKTTSFENPWKEVQMGDDDEEILRQLENGGYGQRYQILAQGRWQEAGDYPSQNEADWDLYYKLAWLTNNDGGRMYAIFKETLLMRDQSEKHPSYYPRTIQEVIKSRNGNAGDQDQGVESGKTKEMQPALCMVTDSATGQDDQDKPNAGEPNEGQESSSDVTRDNSEGVAETAPTRYSCSDQGNAQRLIARHGRDLRYVYAWGKWLIFDGRRWIVDETGEVHRRAKETAKSIYGEAQNITEEGVRRDLVKHALQTESEARRRSMITSAQSEPGVPVLPNEFDQDPWLLNCLNGTIDLRTGDIRSHQREDLLTKICPVEFDTDADCPVWMGFLRRVLAEDEERISFIQKAVGYSLTGDVSVQCLFILYGLGANGKTTLLETIKELLGDYAIQTSSETFLSKNRGGQIPNDLAALRGSRLVASMEVDAGRYLSEALIKQVTGSDEISARFLHKEFFSYKPQFKVWMGTNYKPVIRGSEHAIWRRIRLIPFTVQIPKQEQDDTLGQKLRLELSGILNWALEGCQQWQRAGLTAPEVVQVATQEYREEMDVLAEFFTERCIVDTKLSVPAGDLYKAYGQWAADRGEKETLSPQAFGLELTARGFGQKRSSQQRRRLGLALRIEQ